MAIQELLVETPPGSGLYVYTLVDDGIEPSEEVVGAEPWVSVTPEDITNRWRPLTPAERTISDALIQDAQDMLEFACERAGIVRPTGSQERWERTYIRIVTSMVRRVLRNPDGYLSERVDDYEYRRGDAESAGDLFVTDSECDQLRPADGRRRSGAFSIAPRY